MSGCGSEEKPFVPPKGLASSGASATDDLLKPGAKAGDPAGDQAKKGTDDKALDIGSKDVPADNGSALPDLPVPHQSSTAPDIEFEGKSPALEPAKPPTPAPSNINWSPSQSSAEVIAASADKAMANLKNTAALIPVLATYGDLKGIIRCQLKVSSASKYWVQCARFEDGAPHQAYDVSDGVKKMRMGNTASSRQTWGAGHKDELPPVDRLADAWLIDMPKMALSTWISGQPIFLNLVKSLKQNGFTVKVEKLKLVRPEHTYVQDRLTFHRSATAPHADGEAQTVLLFDHDRGLPVTIEVLTNPVKQKPVKLLWRAQWVHTVFPDKVFSSLSGT